MALLGLTPVTLRLLASLASVGLDRAVQAVYAPQAGEDSCPRLTVPVRLLPALRESDCGMLVVASDAEKEDLLCAALPFIAGTPKVVVPGTGTCVSATGCSKRNRRGYWCRRWPTATRTRWCTCTSAWRTPHGCACGGVVAEFGMLKGGTTMFLSRIIERLGADWPVIGFDTFRRVPPAPLGAGHVRTS